MQFGFHLYFIIICSATALWTVVDAFGRTRETLGMLQNTIEELRNEVIYLRFSVERYHDAFQKWDARLTPPNTPSSCTTFHSVPSSLSSQPPRSLFPSPPETAKSKRVRFKFGDEIVPPE